MCDFPTAFSWGSNSNCLHRQSNVAPLLGHDNMETVLAKHHCEDLSSSNMSALDKNKRNGLRCLLLSWTKIWESSAQNQSTLWSPKPHSNKSLSPKLRLSSHLNEITGLVMFHLVRIIKLLGRMIFKKNLYNIPSVI